MYSFTVECDNKYGLAMFDIQIANSENLSVEQNILRIKKTEYVQCLFDTGANCTTISRRTADKLGIIHGERHASVLAASNKSEVCLTEVDILLPNDILIHNHTVGIQEMLPDVLIGTDIIHYGDFALTSRNGKQLLSFAIPHSHQIDFQNQDN